MIKRIKAWFGRRLIDCRDWWKLWSIRLAAFASVVISYVVASPEILLQVLNAMPPEMRAYFPPVFGFVLFGVITMVRLWDQNHKKGE